jgi:hypothetical protein
MNQRFVACSEVTVQFFTSDLKRNVCMCDVGDCLVIAYTINFPLMQALSIKHNYVEFETPTPPPTPFLLTEQMVTSSRDVNYSRRYTLLNQHPKYVGKICRIQIRICPTK